jgi:hypothetical protein
MLADSREISSQRPSPEQCHEVGYRPSGRVMQPGGFAVYGSVTGRQVGSRICPPPPYRMWVQLQETLLG